MAKTEKKGKEALHMEVPSFDIVAEMEFDVGLPLMAVGVEGPTIQEKKDESPSVGKAFTESGGGEWDTGEAAEGGRTIVKVDDARVKGLEKQFIDSNERISGVEEKVVRLTSRVSEALESVSMITNSLSSFDDVRSELVKIEETTRELTALYDMLSVHLNPFVDSPANPGGGMGNATSQMGEVGVDDEIERISRDQNPFIEGPSQSAGLLPQPGGVGAAVAPGHIDDYWLLKWIEFIIERVHQEHISMVLKYYQDIGWIDGRTLAKIVRYMEGMSELPDFHVAIVDEGGKPTVVVDDASIPTGEWKLSLEDHIQSLDYIKKMRGLIEKKATIPGEGAETAANS